jgi:hypothetical protein
MQISKYVSLKEATKSDYAIRKQINNIPDDGQLVAMKNVATNVFDKVREHFGKPIGISSFFRSKEINKAIGGSINSDHCNGCAIDIDADIFGGVKNSEIFNYIKNNLEFDQLLSIVNAGLPIHIDSVYSLNEYGDALDKLAKEDYQPAKFAKALQYRN